MITIMGMVRVSMRQAGMPMRSIITGMTMRASRVTLMGTTCCRLRTCA